MKNIFLTIIGLLAGTLLTAQENVQPEQLDSVVIDTKTAIAVKNSGKVITVINSETIKQNQGSSVAELINEVSGFEINGGRSNDGQNLSYFVRGGSNRQVVILLDGIQMNDASQIANDYDLRLIPASSVASIEIIKGASSVLYGSGAGTAVISITTKKSSKQPISASFSSTLGTNRASGDPDNDIEFFTNYARVNGTTGKFFYDVNFSNRYTEGLSAIAAPEGSVNFEADIFNRYNGHVNLGVQISEKIKISQFFSIDNYKAGFDDFSYVDAENRSISKQLKTGGHFEWNYNQGRYTFNDSYTRIEREIQSSFPAMFNSRAYTFDTYLDHRFTNKFRVLLGLNGNFSRFDSYNIPFGETEFVQQVDAEMANFSIIDPYVNVVYISDFGLNINTGIRLNIHSTYDTHVVYSVNPSYVFDFGKGSIKVLGSYSTAYITPSLFQLYDPLFGNEVLLPEENRTVEGGLTYTFGDRFMLSAVYFNRSEDNYVDFVMVDPDLFIFQYQNTSESFKASGVEVAAKGSFGTKWNVAANYTNTQADDRFALRIPEHKLNASMGYRLGVNSTLGLKYQFVGEREDAFFNPETFESDSVMLSSYGLLGLSARTSLNEIITLFAAVTNVLDEEYEELYRFQTKGRNVRLGFTLDF